MENPGLALAASTGYIVGMEGPTMMQIALWSKFPSSFVKKIIPKLEKRGYDVVKLLSPATKVCDLSEVSAIFHLNEMCSHAENDRLNVLAAKYQKQVIRLSRKQANWNRDLAVLETVMANAHTVSDAKISDFCRKFIGLREEGLQYRDMLKPLAPYWERGRLTNHHQLQVYISSLAKQPRTPQFFKDYYKESINRRKEIRKSKDLSPKAVVSQTLPSPSSEFAKPEEHQTAEMAPETVLELPNSAPGEVKGEMEMELNLYRESNEKLTLQIKAQADRIRELNSELLKKNAEQNKANQIIVAPKEDTKILKVIKSISDLVELGLMEKTEAFDKIVAFTNKK